MTEILSPSAQRAMAAADAILEAKGRIDAAVESMDDGTEPVDFGGGFETKVRHVRTPEGAKKYGLPIGTPIVSDGKGGMRELGKEKAPNEPADKTDLLKGKEGLKNLTTVPRAENPFAEDGWTRVKAANGDIYDVGYDEDNDTWVATGDQGKPDDPWDDVVVDWADDAEEAMRVLNRSLNDDGSRKEPGVIQNGSQKMTEPQRRSFDSLTPDQQATYKASRKAGLEHRPALNAARSGALAAAPKPGSEAGKEVNPQYRNWKDAAPPAPKPANMDDEGLSKEFERLKKVIADRKEGEDNFDTRRDDKRFEQVKEVMATRNRDKREANGERTEAEKQRELDDLDKATRTGGLTDAEKRERVANAATMFGTGSAKHEAAKKKYGITDDKEPKAKPLDVSRPNSGAKENFESNRSLSAERDKKTRDELEKMTDKELAAIFNVPVPSRRESTVEDVRKYKRQMLAGDILRERTAQRGRDALQTEHDRRQKDRTKLSQYGNAGYNRLADEYGHDDAMAALKGIEGGRALADIEALSGQETEEYIRQRKNGKRHEMALATVKNTPTGATPESTQGGIVEDMDKTTKRPSSPRESQRQRTTGRGLPTEGGPDDERAEYEALTPAQKAAYDQSQEDNGDDHDKSMRIARRVQPEESNKPDLPAMAKAAGATAAPGETDAKAYKVGDPVVMTWNGGTRKGTVSAEAGKGTLQNTGQFVTVKWSDNKTSKVAVEALSPLGDPAGSDHKKGDLVQFDTPDGKGTGTIVRKNDDDTYTVASKDGNEYPFGKDVLSKAPEGAEPDNFGDKGSSQESAKTLDTLNPSDHGVFEDYESGRQFRATAPLGENMTTLAETTGNDPDGNITLYRGAPEGSSDTIQPGDFVTTSKQLAQDYAGTGRVISMKAKYGDVLDDKDEPEGDEYIYRPRTAPDGVSDTYEGGDAGGAPEPAPDAAGSFADYTPEELQDELDDAQRVIDRNARRGVPATNAEKRKADIVAEQQRRGSSEKMQGDKPADPMTIKFAHRRGGSGVNQGATYGQDIEPAGRYLTDATPGGNFPESDYDTGEITFGKPLHLNWGTDYANDDSWKRRLSAAYDGKTGRDLSQAVRDDGYDAIVTYDKYGSNEIVDLSMFDPKGTTPKEKVASKNNDVAKETDKGVPESTQGGIVEDMNSTIQPIITPGVKYGHGKPSLRALDADGNMLSLSGDVDDAEALIGRLIDVLDEGSTRKVGFTFNDDKAVYEPKPIASWQYINENGEPEDVTEMVAARPAKRAEKAAKAMLHPRDKDTSDVTAGPATAERPHADKTPLEIDKELGRLYTEAYEADRKADQQMDELRKAFSRRGEQSTSGVTNAQIREEFRARIEADKGYDYSSATMEERQAHFQQERTNFGGYGADGIQRMLDRHDEQVGIVRARNGEANSYNEEFDARGGWGRAYLVEGSNGHVHTSMGCSSCNKGQTPTQFSWLPDYSAKGEDKIVEDAGERACTVCYPSAPVDVTNRPTKMYGPNEIEAQKAREQREVEKQERLKKKIEKGLTDDGSELRVPYSMNGNGTVRTEGIKSEVTGRRALQEAMADEYRWQKSDNGKELDGPSKGRREINRQRVMVLTDAIAKKHGTSRRAVWDEMVPKAAKNDSWRGSVAMPKDHKFSMPGEDDGDSAQQPSATSPDAVTPDAAPETPANPDVTPEAPAERKVVDSGPLKPFEMDDVVLTEESYKSGMGWKGTDPNGIYEFEFIPRTKQVLRPVDGKFDYVDVTEWQAKMNGNSIKGGSTVAWTTDLNRLQKVTIDWASKQVAVMNDQAEKKKPMRSPRTNQSIFDVYEKKDGDVRKRLDDMGIPAIDGTSRGGKNIPVRDGSLQRVADTLEAFEKVVPGFGQFVKGVTVDPSMTGKTIASASLAPRQGATRRSPQHERYEDKVMVNLSPSAAVAKSDEQWEENMAKKMRSSFARGANHFPVESGEAVQSYWGMKEGDSSFHYVLTHELGHVVQYIVQGVVADEKSKGDRAKERASAELSEVMQKHKVGLGLGLLGDPNGSTRYLNANRLATNLSRYGSTNIAEFYAETWAAYMLDPEPTEFVKDAGAVIERLLKQRITEWEEDHR